MTGVKQEESKRKRHDCRYTEKQKLEESRETNACKKRLPLGDNKKSQKKGEHEGQRGLGAALRCHECGIQNELWSRKIIEGFYRSQKTDSCSHISIRG